MYTLELSNQIAYSHIAPRETTLSFCYGVIMPRCEGAPPNLKTSRPIEIDVNIWIMLRRTS